MVSDLVYVAGSGAVPIVVLGLDAFSTVGRALQCPDSRGGRVGAVGACPVIYSSQQPCLG